MKRLLRIVPQLGLLCLLSLATSLSPNSRADTGPPAPALSSPITGPTWAVLGPMTRLLPIDTYAGKTGGPLALDGGRNEVADGQLALFAASKPWQGVRLSFSKLKGPGKSSIGAGALRWRRIALVMTQKPNYQTRYVGLWPDPLLPAAPFDVNAHGRAFAWIDLHIPASAKAGIYKGTLILSSNGEASQSVPIALHVWGYTMPRQSHLRTAFRVGFEGSHPLDEAAASKDLLAHRITPTNSVGAASFHFPAKPGQTLTVDWTAFDKAMAQRLAQGMTGLALNMDSNHPEWAGLYQQHLIQKGWLKYAYIYAADEPTPNQYPALNQTIAAFKRAAPLIPIMVTARGYPQALRNIDIWCPCIVVERDDYFQPDVSLQQQQIGKACWWYPAYPTHAPAINLWTDYPLLDERIWPWLTWKEHQDGILYWAVTNWQSDADPLHDARTFLDANGDGELFYPGAQGKPIDSMRLECLRDGLQDYEVLCSLEAGARELNARHKSPALAQQAEALCAITTGLIIDYKHFNKSPESLLITRASMNQTLQQIVAALGHDPKIIGRPVYRPALPLVP